MKIGLLTYFWENNIGQFWQALTTLRALRGCFPDASVELVNVRHSGRIRGNFIARAALMKPWLLPASYRALKGFRIGREQHFRYSPDECLTHDYDEAMRFIERQRYDLLIVGADVVLSPLPETRVRGRLPLYWLSPNLPCPKALLASSADTTRLETLPPAVAEQMARSLSGFDYIGVRDSMTARLCHALGTASVPIQRVPDPAFSLEPDPAWAAESATAFPRRNKRTKRAIVRFSNRAGIEQITATLARMGFEVISVVTPLPSARHVHSLSPAAWAAMSTTADLLVTMSFHESIFAIKHARPVVAIDTQPNRFDPKTHESKTRCLMEDFGLAATNHLNLHASGNFSTSLEQRIEAAMEIDYGKVYRRHQDFKQQYAEALLAVKNLTTSPRAP